LLAALFNPAPSAFMKSRRHFYIPYITHTKGKIHAPHAGVMSAENKNGRHKQT
jgi:hypothetical protein